MRIVFMGTPKFALPTLVTLNESAHEVVAAYTQPPRPAGRGQKETRSPVHEYAAKHKIPVLTPETLKSKESHDAFAAHKADIAVVVAYGLLLPKPILTAFRFGCINVHPSLLPRWRGAAPIQRTIMAGDKETGVVIMQMDEGLDTGDMLMTERYAIPDGTNAGELQTTLAEKAAPLVLKTLEALHAGTAKPIKQPDTGVEYAKKITKEECRIDWNRPAEVIRQQILGLSPAPGANFAYKGESIKIFDAVCESFKSAAPGVVVNDALGIACNPGVLRPLQLQRPGKNRMSASELLRGLPIPAGTALS